MSLRKFITILILICLAFLAWGCGEDEEIVEEEIIGEEKNLQKDSIEIWKNLTLVNTYQYDDEFDTLLLSPYDPYLLIGNRLHNELPFKSVKVLKLPELETIMEVEPEEGLYLGACFFSNQQLLVCKGFYGSFGMYNESMNIIRIPTGEVLKELGDIIEDKFFPENTITYNGRTILLGHNLYNINFEVFDVNGELLFCSERSVSRNFRISHGGKYYMSQVSDYNNEIRVWETPNILVQIIDGYDFVDEDGDEYDISEYNISPDGKYIAAVDGDDDIVRVLDTETLHKVFKDFIEFDYVRRVIDFSPDGKMLAVCGKYMLKILSVPDGKTITIIHYLDVENQTGLDIAEMDASVAFSPDGKYLIIYFEGEIITVWKPE
ncbi:hypothetical protein GF312_01075 [Candidatus Poribacteria bacterium]|nr:hypothetical protein [Candidatus Poribacteria bacterium]